jgi:hypothetical protein
MWPTFAAAVLADGAIVTIRPLAGDGESFAGGVLLGLITNLLAVVTCSRPLGIALRRRRTDMPADVARNYGGTAAVLAATAVILALGLAHHRTVVAQQRAYRDAIVRAVAFIGDHAPAPFRIDADHPDTLTIEPGSIYRTCVPSVDGTRTYCVIVKERLPPAQSVVFAGYEPNAVFGAGVN